ncbi:protein FAM170B-like [Diprion similis]|uniref:protein FAM170B-like n=1 Tax=Diprion similis TaxID=362088 RepID=UPI001EF8BC24|nr:protein FAM170B-like [Diprion similis]
MSLHGGTNVTHLAMETVDRRSSAQDVYDENLTLVQVVSEVVQELETQREMSETEYEQFLADVWIGVVLTLMVLSCVCCMCSCLLYHKFQQWKRHVLEQRAAASRDPDCRGGDTESLPSYTLVSGLPSYEEALQQLKQVQALRRGVDHVVVDCEKQVEAQIPSPIGSASLNYANCAQPNQMSRLSVAELLQFYKIQQQQQQQQQPQPQPQPQLQQQLPPYQQQIEDDIQQQGIVKN